MRRAPRRRTLLLIALALVLAGVATAGFGTLAYVRSVVPATVHAVAELDEGVRKTVVLPEPAVPMHLCMVVDSAEQPVPAVSAEIRSPEGEAISTSPVRGWTGRFGRVYRRVLAFDPGEHGSIDVLVTIAPEQRVGGEDFVLLRDPGRVLDQASASAAPWWSIGGGLVAVAVGVFFVAVLAGPPVEPEQDA